MTKILGVAVALLLLAVTAMGWQLKGAWADSAVARREAEVAGKAVEQQRQQAEMVLARLDALDTAVQGLDAKTKANAEQLGQKLAAIETITKTEGDSDESVSCLDVRVPGQLDGQLR